MKKLISQLSGLTIIQGLATLMPLLLVPHLMRTIGAEGFGQFNTALLAASLTIPVFDMGFDLFASRQVARKEGSMNHLLGMHLQQRLLLLLPVGLLYLLLTEVIPSFQVIRPVMHFGLLYAFITSLLPNWYFEGNKRFHIVQWGAFGWKLIYTSLTFFWVQRVDQTPAVMAINALGGGALLLFYLLRMRTEGVRPEWVSWKAVLQSLRENSPIFITPMTTYLVTFMPSLIVSFLLSPAQFGYYAVVDRVLQVFRLPASLLSTVVYVQYNELLRKGQAAFQRFFNWVSLLVYGGGILGVAFLLLIKMPLLNLLTAGLVEEEALLAYQVLLWSGIFIIQRNHLQKLLLSLNAEKALARSSVLVLLLMPLLFVGSYQLAGHRALFMAIVGYELLFVLVLGIISRRHVHRFSLSSSPPA